MALTYADGGSGLVLGAFSVIRDEAEDVTGYAAIGPDGATLTLPAGVLSDGPHELAFRIRDAADNLGEATRTIVVDRTPPALQLPRIVAPACRASLGAGRRRADSVATPANCCNGNSVPRVTEGRHDAVESRTVLP